MKQGNEEDANQVERRNSTKPDREGKVAKSGEGEKNIQRM